MSGDFGKKNPLAPPLAVVPEEGRCWREWLAETMICALPGAAAGMASHALRARSLDQLLERDKRREEDGFPRKIRVGRMIRPGRGGDDKVVVVPTTVEEKLMHDPTFQPPEDGAPDGGSGEGEEG